MEREVAAALDAVVDAAVAAWPGVALDADAFRRALLAAASTPAALAGLHASDLYLAQACAAGDARAIELFDRDWLSQVPKFLTRHAALPQADEVRQILRERLLVAPARIAGYTGRGSLAGWLRVATLRVASNLLRGTREHAELRAETVGVVAGVPELRVLEGTYREAFRTAFREAFAALDPEERAVLKLRYLDGVTVRELAPILDVSVATAGRRILAAEQRLGEAVVERLAASVELPEGDVASVVRALVSRLEISMSALLA